MHFHDEDGPDAPLPDRMNFHYNAGMDVRARMTELVNELLQHQRLYYVLNRPELSDHEYDRLFDELLQLEARYPQHILPHSPSHRIGSDLDNAFPEKPHAVPVLSLDKAYAATEVQDWANKVSGQTGRPLDFTVEEKLDGAAIVLYYHAGLLVAALTRGNGLSGNDVTANVRTLHQVPLRIAEPGDLAVRGEIYLEKKDFSRYNASMENRYANPRNLAAGSLRNIQTAQAARVPLNIFVYESHFAGSETGDHPDALHRLHNLGFRVNPLLGFFSDDVARRRHVHGLFPECGCGPLADLSAFIERQTQTRHERAYEIDGLVVKVADLAARADLGETAHHPRWAMAFKFDAPLARTRLKEIVVQVGRNGKVTPVAVLEPVKISGSTVARATLHNQDYIDALELGPGDEVSISKRGDVIPAVETVLEKSLERPLVFRLPAACPFCHTTLTRQGAHHYCPNETCPERLRRTLIHFVARAGMDIETLGEQTISLLLEYGWVRDVADLYTFDWERLRGIEGFKEKKIARIRAGMERSKTQPFVRILAALGLEGVGPAAAADLVEHGFDSLEKIIAAATRDDRAAFAEIAGIGDVLAGLLVGHFRNPRLLELFERLRGAGLRLSAGDDTPRRVTVGPFAGQVWVVTGSFENFRPALPGRRRNRTPRR